MILPDQRKSNRATLFRNTMGFNGFREMTSLRKFNILQGVSRDQKRYSLTSSVSKTFIGRHSGREKCRAYRLQRACSHCHGWCLVRSLWKLCKSSSFVHGSRNSCGLTLSGTLNLTWAVEGLFWTTLLRHRIIGLIAYSNFFPCRISCFVPSHNYEKGV